jgi:iduronate 2-sulfatase
MDRIQAPPFSESEMHIAPEWAYFTKPANWGMTVLQRREAIRAYYASISFMDAQVGRLLHALEQFGLAQDTTIVFWGDNGYQLGEHGQWMKQTVFEPASRIPLVFGGAGVGARGQASPRTVELLDLYPTLVDVCSLRDAPANLQGRSLAPLLANVNAPRDFPAISQVRRITPEKHVMGYSLHTERYRYSFWNEASEGEELYDYQADPRTLRNLESDTASADLKQKLRSRLEEICRTRGMAAA